MSIVTDGIDLRPSLLVPSHQESAFIGYLLDELCLGLRVGREVPTMHLGLHDLLDVLSRDLHPSEPLGGSLNGDARHPKLLGNPENRDVGDVEFADLLPLLRG